MTKPPSLLIKTHFCFYPARMWDDLKMANSIRWWYQICPLYCRTYLVRLKAKWNGRGVHNGLKFRNDVAWIKRFLNSQRMALAPRPISEFAQIGEKAADTFKRLEKIIQKAFDRISSWVKLFIALSKLSVLRCSMTIVKMTSEKWLFLRLKVPWS